MYLGQRFNPNSELAQEYEFSLMCIGQSHYSPFFDNKNFANWKDQRGRIFVNEFFQVTDQNPEIESPEELKQDSVVYENIFCYGDAWVTRMKEVK